ncbi:Uncharacterised protein [Serratia ficaria]|nr:Uncharacterised protein [Serratia ficaria]
MQPFSLFHRHLAGYGLLIAVRVKVVVASVDSCGPLFPLRI